MLGDRQLVFSGYINGRIEEAQVLAAYSNLSHRLNWAIGVQQEPYFFYQGSGVSQVPGSFENVLATQVRRIVLRSAFLQAAYPVSRFRRVEFGFNATNVDDAILNFNEYFDPISGLYTRDPELDKIGLESANFIQPTVALVDDNTFFGFVGPWFGRRARFEIAQTIGGWDYTQLTADYRRYDKIVGPVTFATRAMYFGRSGSDAGRFSIFLGYPELIRGYTSGSFRNNECLTSPFTQNSATGCAELDQLVGTSIGVFNAEIRFPILSPLWGIPPLVPPIEGAFFYDVGVAWNDNSKVEFRDREPGESATAIRVPLRSYGASVRTNLLGFLILRFDYAKPLNRPGKGAFWTISLGPTF
jgi:hypothetical protein